MGILSSFISNQKVINSWALNLLGIQVWRVVVFKAALIVARWNHGIVLRDDIRALDRDGIVVIPDYLTSDQFQAASDAFRALMASDEIAKKAKFKKPEAVDITNARLTRDLLTSYPALRPIFDSPQISNAVGYLSGKKNVPVSEIVLELIRHREGEVDADTAVHTDTFFSNQNAWYFVDDCPLESGPFVYGIGSHRITLRRLLFQYLASLRSMRGEAGSARLTAGFKKLMNVDPRPIPVKANTLIISNNFGFHARGAGVPGTHRAAFKLSMKETPFSRIGGEIADAAREKRVPAGA
jgi:hypothetical protein